MKQRSLAVAVTVLVSAGACGVGPDERSESEAAVSTVASALAAAGTVLVCTNSNLGGTCYSVGPGKYAYTTFVPNDSLSSLQVGSGVRVTVFRDSEFRSSFATYYAGQTVNDMTSTAVGNDAASSMRVESASDPDCRVTANPASGWIQLFRDWGYQGDCVSLPWGDYKNPAEMGICNDCVSSYRIGDSTKIELYNDANFINFQEGNFISDPDMLSPASNDRTSSIKVKQN